MTPGRGTSINGGLEEEHLVIQEHRGFCVTKESSTRGFGRGRGENPEAGEFSQGLDSRWESPGGLAGSDVVGVCHRSLKGSGG